MNVVSFEIQILVSQMLRYDRVFKILDKGHPLKTGLSAIFRLDFLLEVKIDCRPRG